ncbi:hypothetical protein D3C72_1856490 [compost metagenome]
MRVVLEVGKQRLEVLDIKQQQALAISHLEGGIQRRLLAVGQLQQVTQQQRPHFTQGGAQRMAGLPVNIPQVDRVCLRPMCKPRHAGDALGDFALRVTHRAQATQIAFDVGGKYGHSRITEGFGHVLQGHGLAGTRGTSHQAVTVGQAQGLSNRLSGQISAENELQRVRHVFAPSI